jgi:ABC-2 type transport system ATP-binding protein
MNLLEVNNLEKQFGSHKAVDKISFTIAPGSIFGLLGPNGAGKTTLIRMITGIFHPDQGQIIFDGQPFVAKDAIQKMGYMPEERGLYKKMKVGEHAIYLAQLRGLSTSQAKEKVLHWFNKFEMNSWWNKKVQDLSKGMGQKLQFVSTILHEPKLIILDEPFSGLDPVNSNLIKDEIFNLAKNGSTIIFSTHRMEQVEEICDKIILVNKGQKILDGSVDEIKEQFKENIFQLTTNNVLNEQQHAPFNILNQKENNYTIQLKPQATNNDVLKYVLQQNDITIKAFNEILPSLNEIFIKQTVGTPTSRQFVA